MMDLNFLFLFFTYYHEATVSRKWVTSPKRPVTVFCLPKVDQPWKPTLKSKAETREYLVCTGQP